MIQDIILQGSTDVSRMFLWRNCILSPLALCRAKLCRFGIG